MKAVTVSELYNTLGALVKSGKGSKKILLSSDDEGNGFHEMLFLVSEVEQAVSEEYQLPYGVNMKTAKAEYVVLG